MGKPRQEGIRGLQGAVGINTNSATALSYIIGLRFYAAAGIMVGILYNSITPALGETPSYKMLAIIVLGGLGNPVGTVIAGLLSGCRKL